MATGRFLKKNIAKSERINQLSDSMALFYTWLIPFLDDFGLVWISPKKLKWEIYAAREIFTIPYIQECIATILNLKVIKIVNIEDKYWLWFPDFTEKQTLRKDRKPQTYLDNQQNWAFSDKIASLVVNDFQLATIWRQVE